MARKQVINTFNININTNTNISHLNLFIVDCVLVAVKQVINCHHTPSHSGFVGQVGGRQLHLQSPSDYVLVKQIMRVCNCDLWYWWWHKVRHEQELMENLKPLWVLSLSCTVTLAMAVPYIDAYICIYIYMPIVNHNLYFCGKQCATSRVCNKMYIAHVCTMNQRTLNTPCSNQIIESTVSTLSPTFALRAAHSCDSCGHDDAR